MMGVMPPSLEQAVEEILELKREVQRLELLVHQGDEAVADLNVQCKFWRQAAEHAVTGWNKLEDEHELLKDTLRALVTEPPTIVSPEGAPVDLRLVEEESPWPPKK